MDNVEGNFLETCIVVQCSGFREAPGFESHTVFVNLSKLLNLSEPQYSHLNSFNSMIILRFRTQRAQYSD